jgi:hypothetical protein
LASKALRTASIWLAGSVGNRGVAGALDGFALGD